MSEWYRRHIPATHSIAYSVAYMQAKTVEIEEVSRVGFEAVGAVDFGDERRIPPMPQHQGYRCPR